MGLQGSSGSINKKSGGHTFLKNGVIRRRVVPANPQTESQMAVRSAFSFFTEAWKTLTEAERSAWNAARNSGDFTIADNVMGVSRPYASGKDLFIALNTNAMVGNGTTTAELTYTHPPARGENDIDFVFGSITMAAGTGAVAFIFDGTPTNNRYVVKMTRPVSPGNMRLDSVRSYLRIVGVASAAGPTSLAAGYAAANGAITESAGQKSFYLIESVNQSDGTSRVVASGSVIIAA